MSRANPQVASFLKYNVFDSTNVVNFRDNDIRSAFGIEGYWDKTSKDDPRYVKSMVRFKGNKDGKGYEKIFDYHKCTAEDFESFAPPSPEAAGTLEIYKKSKTR